ncbi:Major facilitator superfamily domain, general substrate transporter [Lasallia pustulata]|uniref:Major facilitator superfamily domain, general substrate transporter n=1 Tax=Lasallia pustulata TaxID=136370 RepID=A0A1W5CZL2_9LECA|nr:Major facilitator superfamily domain, general substrate transporter [Lasallia pustulata]
MDQVTTAASKPTTFLAKAASELGVYSIVGSTRDTKLLCLQRFIRLFAYGASTLILVLYLSSLGISEARIGLFMTLTLLGDVVISFGLTLFADGLGRRRILVLGAALMSASGVVFAFSGNYWVLVAASIFGVISPSGNEIGPFRAIEESTLAQLTPSNIRSDIFAWYTLIGTAGTAIGTIICGWLVQGLQARDGWAGTRAYRVIFGLYTFLGMLKLASSLMLSDKCEPEPEKQERHDAVELGAVEAAGLLSDDDEADDPPKPKNTATPSAAPKKKKSIWPQITPASRAILLKLCLLFAVDSMASGLVPASWVTYFFTKNFGLPEGELGTLFFVTNIISAASNLVASSIAKRIGLVRAMVFTHLPSAIFLALIPLPSVVWLAMTFLILRSCSQSMDQAPRQAFLAAVVLPTERTAVMGVVNVIKTLSQSVGPVVTGWLAGIDKFWIVFMLAGAMKASYDLGMLRMFLGHQTQEDRRPEGRQDA